MSRSPINEGRNSPTRQRATPVELTPVHQRASRRLRGDSPEFAPLSFTPRETRTTDAATMTSQALQRILLAPRAWTMDIKRGHAKRFVERRHCESDDTSKPGLYRRVPTASIFC
ncbi:hypothetical protein HPB50_019786 [Hyalomma asiaticum]|uniref:Uncharacterized protein n=1 Tax=Hyalomma asiaticum TaxID=266040 RepID=A0ACB7S2G8_HYAAI|nr:hypothetical protein HPB50_019786 [Hyalomma asiaticum]